MKIKYLLLSVIIFFTIFAVLKITGDQPAAAQPAAECPQKQIDATSFLKTYHLRDNTEGFGVLPTKDGGFVLTGETIRAGGMQEPYPYVVKTDAKGNKLWTRDFSSASNALGNMSSSHFGRLAVETSDGGIITASDVVDFVDEKTKELYGDILITRFNSKGIQSWSILIGDYSIDRPQKIWALPDGGIMLLARFMETGHGKDVADTEAVPKYSALIQVDKKGSVQSFKKMSWNALDMQRLADGSFIALANIAIYKTEQPENIVGPEIVMGDIPTAIRLDRNLNVSWAKSLEMIPSEISAPTSYTGNAVTIGKTKIRLAGGDFRSVQLAPDGGFLVFGFANQLLTQGLSGGAAISLTELGLRPLMAVKFDAAGNYQWAKKLDINLISGGAVNDFHVVKTFDHNFVIMKNTVRDGDGLEAKEADAAKKRRAYLDECAKHEADCVNIEKLAPKIQPFAKAMNEALKKMVAASAINIGLVKTDADFNPIWVKKIDAERELSGYSLQPTADKGIIIAGSMLTNKTRKVMGIMTPYTEAALIKLDANGSTNKCMQVSNRTGAKIEDQSAYLVAQNMAVAGAEKSALKINKKVKEKTAVAKNIVKNICQYFKNKIIPACSRPDSTVSSPLGQAAITPTTKTWVEINFENAKEAKIGSAKNQSIHDELLLILNPIFSNQVKMVDSMDSMWLTYYLSRPVTRADVEAVQKYYEGRGYKIEESEGGRLYVSRVGLSLRFTFSVNDSMKGKIEVLF